MRGSACHLAMTQPIKVKLVKCIRWCDESLVFWGMRGFSVRGIEERIRLDMVFVVGYLICVCVFVCGNIWGILEAMMSIDIGIWSYIRRTMRSSLTLKTYRFRSMIKATAQRIKRIIISTMCVCLFLRWRRRRSWRLLVLLSL